MYLEFDDYQERMKEEYLENEMYRRAATVESKLCEIVHPKYVNQFASVLRLALAEELPAADIIASGLHLSILDFLAFEGNSKIFNEMCLEELEKEKESAAFDRYIDELAG